ncbi:MAG TPA: response regulator [Ignavibacteriaceae bacterium]|nr:response regulator [Ignavibacteriaceae bacterium]HQJ46119.1 response regulator [Ignavibacteriaceae bacterium]
MDKTADILVIDDEQVIIDAVLKICALEDYSVDSAINTKTGLEKISKNFYPIIISDIMMPDGDGFQILDTINKYKKDSVVIMTTGFSTVENAVNSLYKGALSFIPKPFTVDELLSVLFRAKNYIKIIKEEKSFSPQQRDKALIYVTCPAKYFRLGHSTWMVQEREGSVLVGICDIYMKAIESVTNIEMLQPEDELIQGTACATLTSSDERIHKVLAPLSGRIVEVNNNVINNPLLIEKDPYFDGWLYRIIPANLDYEIKYLIPCSSDRL